MLGFYINAESRADRRAAMQASLDGTGRVSIPPNQLWRLRLGDKCFKEGNNTCPPGKYDNFIRYIYYNLKINFET